MINLTDKNAWEREFKRFTSFLKGEKLDEDFNLGLDERVPDLETLSQSSIVTSESNDLFFETAIESYSKNDNYKGVNFNSREELLDSFSEYLVNSTGKLDPIILDSEGDEFNNIVYLLHKSLLEESKLNNVPIHYFKNYITILTSPLFYEVMIPDNETLNVNNNVLLIMEKHLNTGLYRNRVVTKETYGNSTIVKILKDFKGLLSSGDILRSVGTEDITAYEKMIATDKQLPILLGLHNDKNNFIVDLADETGLAIVGGCGSGKSWLLQQIMQTFFVTNRPEELNVVWCDYKNSMFSKSLSHSPHVIGYHAPNREISTEEYIEKIVKISDEILEECHRRHNFLNENRFESIKEYHSKYKKTNDWEKIGELPHLLFVIDELTSTMFHMKDYDTNLYDKFRSNLATISQISRNTGIKLITVGQRSIDSSIPKNVKANTSLKIGMRMGIDTDYNILFETKNIEDMKPNIMGEMLVDSHRIIGVNPVKGAVCGGNNEYQIRTLNKLISYDWIRRINDKDRLISNPYGDRLKHSFNRDVLVEEAYRQMEDLESLKQR